MAKQKSLKQKQKEHNEKYGHIPLNFNERLSYLYDIFNLDKKPDTIQNIINTRHNMIMSMQYIDLEVVQLLQLPEGAARPRHTILGRKNFHMMAINDPINIHVYSPGAKEGNDYIKHRLSEGELYQLDGLIYTPVIAQYDAYLPTPSDCNVEETILAEIGLIRPEMKKPDNDNISKKYMDMYNANVWLDDATVNSLIVNKYYSVLPRVEIKLKYLNCLYRKNHAKKISNRKDSDIISKPLIYLNKQGELEQYNEHK